MAKFPTEVERSVTVRVPLKRAYQYLWDVVGSSVCIPGLQTCKRVKKDTYRFLFEERSSGPVSLTVCYTARYEGNGKDCITFESLSADGDNTEVSGRIQLEATAPDATRVVLRQMVAPETPIPRLLQGLIKSFVEQESADAVHSYLTTVKKRLEKGD